MSDYLAIPKSALRGGILVLHAWWGLNDFAKQFCNRLANEGYLVLAPDLYGGETAETPANAKRLRQAKIKSDPTLYQILDAFERLKNDSGGAPLGLVGFSLGAWLGLWLVEEKPKEIAATVLFYGARGGDFAQTKSAFLGHYAETDEFVSDSGRKKLARTLKAAGRQVEFHVYPDTRHWFFESDRPEYNEEAARLAWERTLAFLRDRLA
ncbi:MAG: dienelactone hydrolase family protein [Anaerolineales bacterium]|jgi:carboxymethylenebutenolidase|nr:dienelactone hydrolase family protein [Anaerolineales bacterium]MDX9936782.1 dienelactone hydrolase family protein [Anaerolineales bacterium]GER81177.1 dienelactone hydrolase family protein [Candidatus Denitrolinea symbiosum]